MDCVLRAATIIMMNWFELTAAAVVGFTMGVIFMGALMKSVRRIEIEDRIISTLQQQQDWSPPSQPPPHPPKD